MHHHAWLKPWFSNVSFSADAGDRSMGQTWAKQGLCHQPAFESAFLLLSTERNDHMNIREATHCSFAEDTQLHSIYFHQHQSLSKNSKGASKMTQGGRLATKPHNLSSVPGGKREAISTCCLLNAQTYAMACLPHTPHK